MQHLDYPPLHKKYLTIPKSQTKHRVITIFFYPSNRQHKNAPVTISKWLPRWPVKAVKYDRYLCQKCVYFGFDNCHR